MNNSDCSDCSNCPARETCGCPGRGGQTCGCQAPVPCRRNAMGCDGCLGVFLIALVIFFFLCLIGSPCLI